MRLLLVSCVVCVTFFVLGRSAVSAQERMRGEREVALGLRGAWGSSNITFQPSQNRQARSSYEFGLAFRLAQLKHLGMVCELLYAQTGYQTTEYTARVTGHPVPTGQPFECREAWLRLPLFMHLKFPLSFFQVEVLGGGYADYLLSEQIGATSTSLYQQTLYLSTHNRLGVGIEGGAGLGVRTPIGNFMLEYRTWYRLTNLYDRERVPRQDEPRSNVRNQSVGVAYYYVFH